jgi:biopolymer transport protein ExbB
MKRNNLIRAFVLLAALVVVAAVIIAAGSIDSAGIAQGRRQNFFEQFFIAGGPVVWFVLFPMSLITVYLVVEHALTINSKTLINNGPEQLRNKINAPDAERLRQVLVERQDLVSVALRDALDKGKGDWFRMRTVLQESLQDQAAKLLRKIEWLSLIGGVSPMVGLFGTVFGMIKLFNAIVAAGGQPQPAQLADGIGVALVTTFWGLFIAIPALAVHGVFRNRIEVLVGEAVTRSEAVMPLLREVLKDTTAGLISVQRQAEAGQAASETIKLSKVPIVPFQEKSPEAARSTKQ